MQLPQGFRPKLIALDIDGTLVPYDGAVTERVVDSIARVRSAGIMVIASTGRSLSTTAPVAHAAGMDEWAVVSNGAILATLYPEQVQEATTFDCTELIAQIETLVPNGVYGVETPDGMIKTNRHFEHSALAMSIREVSREHLVSDPVIRVVVRSDDHLDGGLGHVAHELGLHSVVFGVAEVAWLDIGPPNVNKATGLARLCERLNITADEVMAIGDSMNDREMLTWAGLGVLMGQAEPEMRPYADLMTTGVPGDGVADALDAIVL